MARTYYEVLGVSQTSSAAELRTAYRKLVLKHHPDQSADPASKEILTAVVTAYEVLGDPPSRKRYDAALSLEAARSKVRESPPPPTPPAPKPQAPKIRYVTDDLVRLSSLFSKGRYAEAETLANKILARNPKEAIPYAVLGDIARAGGNHNQAINMYAHAVQADPRNKLYQQRYEELIRSNQVGGIEVKAEPNATQQSALVFGGGVCLFACVYISLSKEAPLAPTLSLVSTWSLGLVIMLFLCGVSAGVALSVGGRLDRFSSVSTTSLGKIAPAMALGTVAVVSFWAATALYVLLGLTQNAFNYSTSRVVIAVAGVVFLASLAAHFSTNNLNGLQVFLWGGNLSYIGAVCGWMVADSLNRG